MPTEYKTLLGIPDPEFIELDDKSPTGLIVSLQTDDVRAVPSFGIGSGEDHLIKWPELSRMIG